MDHEQNCHRVHYPRCLPAGIKLRLGGWGSESKHCPVLGERTRASVLHGCIKVTEILDLLIGMIPLIRWR